MENRKEISVRDLQHNLSMYLEMAKLYPISITKNGKNKAVLIDPYFYEYKKKRAQKKSNDNLMDSEFVGMYENRKDWKNRSSLEISEDLRKKSWYGK